jgi:hypothetical protein
VLRKPCIAHNPALEPHRCLYHGLTEDLIASRRCHTLEATSLCQLPFPFKVNTGSKPALECGGDQAAVLEYPLLPFCKYRIVDSPADVERER